MMGIRDMGVPGSGQTAASKQGMQLMHVQYMQRRKALEQGLLYL